MRDSQFLVSGTLHHSDPRIAMAEGQSVSCLEFSEFKDALTTLRAVDDKIIHELNTSVPTTSFADKFSAAERCKDLYERVSQCTR
jgi:hypothetical protein